MKKKYLILIIILVIASITIPLLYIYIKNNNKDKQSITIEATVLSVGSDYLLVTDNNNKDYIIYTNEPNYSIGDNLSIDLESLNKDKSPYEATAKTITIINKESENNNNKTEENKSDNNNKLPEISNNNETENNNINNTQEEPKNEENYTESDVITYFETLDEDITTYNNEDETLGQKIKSKFVSCIDFIFYDKEINGIKFKDLTNKTKLKILEITLSIDSKIDSKFPGYKDSISNTYSNIKSKIIEKYLEVTTNICNKEPELCTEAKEGFKNLKNSFGITWDFIKEIIGSGTSKLKDWYEIWRYN